MAGTLRGKRVLALASGDGQQGPILHAPGAEATVSDNSRKMPEKDKEVALRAPLPAGEEQMKEPDEKTDGIQFPAHARGTYKGLTAVSRSGAYARTPTAQAA